MGVPTSGAAFFKVNDTTVKSLAGTFWKELLSGALDVTAGPSRDGRRCSDGLYFNLGDSDDSHEFLHCRH